MKGIGGRAPALQVRMFDLEQTKVSGVCGPSFTEFRQLGTAVQALPSSPAIQDIGNALSRTCRMLQVCTLCTVAHVQGENCGLGITIAPESVTDLQSWRPSEF